MSAIEVLNVWVNKPIIFDERFMTKEDYIEQVNLKVATQEALLALEQKEKLKSWIEKEIYKLEMYGAGREWRTRLNCFKEFKERVSEQR